VNQQALSDVKVLDLTWHIAGPYCTKLLADYGADVVKIERPGLGDPCRRMGPFPQDQPDTEKSGLFLHLNTNKKGITLNLKSETGKEIFLRLLQDADIVVESFGPRVMPSLVWISLLCTWPMRSW
jgi:crotonobetainyl-CoA:carnitine CoA-transferase CaiB-like acyl-CoA transferase